MSKKLTFADVYQNELSISKINFGSLNVGLSISAGAPSADADIGTLYIDNTSGFLYRKTVAGAGSANWTAIAYGNNSLSNTIYTNRVRPLLITSFTNGANFSTGDLVGIYGAGVWSAASPTSSTRGAGSILGAVAAAIASGGSPNNTNATLSTTEIFNGSSWAAGANMTLFRVGHSSLGSQNAGFIASGSTGGGAAWATAELFNGSSWNASGSIISVSKEKPFMVGSMFAAALAAGSLLGAQAVTATDLWNGTVWNVGPTVALSRTCGIGCGSYNAGLISAGSATNGGSVFNTMTELFNGTIWNRSADIPITFFGGFGGGSLNAAHLSGNQLFSQSQLFNGSVWSTGANQIQNFLGFPGGNNGSQGQMLTGAARSFTTTYTHNQATHRKMYARYMVSAKNIGVYDGTNIVLQGNVSFTYPANKYLVVNRLAICSVTNETTLTSVTFSSISGTAPTMTYNFTATMNTLCIPPGGMAIVTSTGSNPCSGVNAGSFLIVRQINPSSIELQNTNGIAENPSTGTISIISSMMAVDNITPDDIVIGKTNSLGNLYISKPLQVGSLARRLK